jgi:hypothetical protein
VCGLFVTEGTDLLERVREGIVPDVVEQRRRLDDPGLIGGQTRELATFLEQRERASSQMVGAERVLEACVCGTRINEVREPQLSHIAQPLEDARVDEAKGDIIDADVVPERVADDFHAGSWVVGRGSGARFGVLDPRPVTLDPSYTRGPARLTASST